MKVSLQEKNYLNEVLSKIGCHPQHLEEAIEIVLKAELKFPSMSLEACSKAAVLIMDREKPSVLNLKGYGVRDVFSIEWIVANFNKD